MSRGGCPGDVSVRSVQLLEGGGVFRGRVSATLVVGAVLWGRISAAMRTAPIVRVVSQVASIAWRIGACILGAATFVGWIIPSVS